MTSMSFTTDPVYRPSAWSENVMRILEEAEYGGGDVFDCIRTLQRIRPGNMEDWISEWSKLADHYRDRAEKAMRDNHRITARKFYLNAYNYYRHASFHILPLEKRKAEFHRAGDACFRKAAALFDPPFEYISVDYEGSVLEGILYRTRRAGRSPAVIYVLGGDATKEEYYFLGVEEALARGLNVLVIDGPGQASSIILRGIKSTHEYEKPVSQFIDALGRRDDIDVDRLAIVGRSLAGYFAPRVAAFEPRIKALVVWGAFYDVYENLHWRVRAVPRYRQIIGGNDDEEFWKRARQYTLKGVAGRITCPTLILHGEADPQVKLEDATRLYGEISSSEKELIIFRLGESGAGHCAHDAPSTVFPLVFDWVADRLNSG